MVSWPSTLETLKYPAAPRKYGTTPPADMIATQMDVGPPKRRRRSGVFYENVDFAAIYDAAEWQALIDFYLGQQVLNPGFELTTGGMALNTGLTSGAVCDDWSILNCDTPFEVFLDTVNPYNGAQDVLLHTLPSQSIAAHTGKYAAVGGNLIPCQPGQSISWGCQASWLGTSALPSGLTGFVTLALEFYAAGGGFLTNQNGSGPSLSAALNYEPCGGSYVIPSTLGGGVPAFVQLACYLGLTNTTGAALLTPSGISADVNFDACSLYFTSAGTNPGVNVVNPFAMLDPETLAMASWKFRSRPTRTALGGGYWESKISLERQP